MNHYSSRSFCDFSNFFNYSHGTTHQPLLTKRYADTLAACNQVDDLLDRADRAHARILPVFQGIREQRLQRLVEKQGAIQNLTDSLPLLNACLEPLHEAQSSEAPALVAPPNPQAAKSPRMNVLAALQLWEAGCSLHLEAQQYCQNIAEEDVWAKAWGAQRVRDDQRVYTVMMSHLYRDDVPRLPDFEERFSCELKEQQERDGVGALLTIEEAHQFAKKSRKAGIRQHRDATFPWIIVNARTRKIVATSEK